MKRDIHNTVCRNTEGSFACDRNGTLKAEIRAAALNSALLHRDDAIAVVETQWTLVRDLDSFVSQVQSRNFERGLELLGHLERTVERTIHIHQAVQAGLSARRIMSQKSGDRRATDLEIGLDRVVAGKVDVAFGLGRGLVYCGGQGQVGVLLGNVHLRTNLGQGLSADL